MKKMYLFVGVASFAFLNAKAQNVGIGVATPTAKLDVAGAYAAKTYAAHPKVKMPLSPA
ncbi:MAG: hypothetical protein NZ534_02280 [Bacteroidia bacterium]|nr:hypothetical protein [Bacteroidia bacterium]